MVITSSPIRSACAKVRAFKAKREGPVCFPDHPCSATGRRREFDNPMPRRPTRPWWIGREFGRRAFRGATGIEGKFKRHRVSAE